MSERPRILLIVPPGGYYAERWSQGQLMPPLGIGYVAAALEQAGFRPEILDAHLDRLKPAALAAELVARRPDIVGVTFTTETRFEGFSVLRLARRLLPGALVVAGGPHASLAARDLLEHIPEVDAVVRGEGEATTTALAEALAGGGPIAGLAGVSARAGGQIVEGPERPPIEDLDAVANPARHLYPPLARYNFRFDVPGQGPKLFANLMTSRGCPFGCNFCASTVMWGRRCRLRSAGHIADEVQQLVTRHGAEALWIFDDTFNTSPARVEAFCAELDRRRLHLPWFCEVRVDRLSRDLLRVMRDAGCYTIGFGVESGSQRILDEVIGKGLKLDQVERVFAWCRELGVIANPFFIFSHPTETWEEARATLALIERHRGHIQPSLALLHVYPGTRLEELARARGVLPADFSWTHENRRDVRTLPSAQGNVPIFVDELTWGQIGELMFRWADSKGSYRIWSKIPRALASIRSPGDLGRYGSLGLAYARLKLRRLLGRG